MAVHIDRVTSSTYIPTKSQFNETRVQKKIQVLIRSDILEKKNVEVKRISLFFFFFLIVAGMRKR